MMITTERDEMNYTDETYGRQKQLRQHVRELRNSNFVREDRLPASNVIITMLYLKSIISNTDIVGSECYHEAQRFYGDIEKDDYELLIQDVWKLIQRGASYYGKPELETIPLGVDNKLIKEAMQDHTVNEICNDLMKIQREDSFDVYIESLLDTLQDVTTMGGRVNRNRELANLDLNLLDAISAMLDVKDEHTFADLTSGYGVSTLGILKERNPRTILRDNAPDTLVLSEMLMVAAGKNVAGMEVKDIFAPLDDKDIEIADRMFIDPPFRTNCTEDNIPEVDGIELKDAWVAAIMKSVKALKHDGKAIITVPAIVLHGSQNGLRDVREYLLENHLLEAVISLPRHWRTSSIPTHLLVLSKKDNRKARFVNMISTENRSFLNRSEMLMLKDILEVKPGKANERYLKDLNYEEISADSFIAGVYISYCETKDYRKDDIDAKLRSLYEEMGRAIEDLLK